MQITLKTNDINPSYSPSGSIIDELAYASGQWTEEDLFENNFSYASEGSSYVYEHFDFEDALLAVTKSATDLLEVASKCNILLAPNDAMLADASNLQAGASCALNMPEKWTELLRAYEDQCKEDDYNDSVFLVKYAPELLKELQESEEYFWKDLRRGWLFGGREYDNNGIIYEIKKYFKAEDVIFDSKNFDEITLDFDDMDLHAEYCGCDTGCDYKNYKADLLGTIQYSGKLRRMREKAESEKRQAERQKTNEYKAKQKASAEAERIAKLQALTK